MNKGIVPIIAIIIAAVLLVGGIGGYVYFKHQTKPVACTEEAKICPDGSAVGRTGPNCEFAECPTVTPTSTTTSTTDISSWKTYKNDKYGFEFSYPYSWEVIGEASGEGKMFNNSIFTLRIAKQKEMISGALEYPFILRIGLGCDMSSGSSASQTIGPTMSALYPDQNIVLIGSIKFMGENLTVINKPYKNTGEEGPDTLFNIRYCKAIEKENFCIGIEAYDIYIDSVNKEIIESFKLTKPLESYKCPKLNN